MISDDNDNRLISNNSKDKKWFKEKNYKNGSTQDDSSSKHIWLINVFWNATGAVI